MQPVLVTPTSAEKNSILDLKEKVGNLEGLRSFAQQRANIEAVQQQNAINYMRGDLMKVWEFDMQLLGAAEFGVGVVLLYKVR